MLGKTHTWSLVWTSHGVWNFNFDFLSIYFANLCNLFILL